MFKPLIGLVLSLALAGVAQAAEWAELTNPSDATRWFIDVNSVAAKGKITNATVRSFGLEIVDNDRTSDEQVVGMSFDCAANKSAMSGQRTYFLKSQLVASSTPKTTAPLIDTPAGSVAATLQTAACGIAKAGSDDVLVEDLSSIKWQNVTADGAVSFDPEVHPLSKEDKNDRVVVELTKSANYRLYNGAPYLYSLFLVIVDCKEGTAGTVEQDMLVANGKMVGRQVRSPKEVKYLPATDAVDTALFKAVCAARLAPPLDSQDAEQDDHEWLDLTVNDNFTRSIDVSSVTLEGNVARGVMNIRFKQPQKTPPLPTFDEETSVFLYDCERRSFTFDNVEFYLKSKKVQGSSPSGATATVFPVKDGSIAAAEFPIVCAIAKAGVGSDLLEGLTKEDWQDAGQSADGRYFVAVAKNVFEKGPYRLVTSMEVYQSYTYEGGLPFKAAAQGSIIDCNARQIAVVRRDLLVGDGRVIQSFKPGDKEKLHPIAGNSAAQRIAAAACAMDAEPFDEDEDASGQVGFGTAWATDKGYIVTASHVVAHAETIELMQGGKKVGVATVVANDPANDLAVLKPSLDKGVQLVTLSLAARPVSLGRQIFTLGFPAPDIMGQSVKMASGEVASLSGMRDDVRHFQMSLPIQPGNSGGPVVSFDGQVMGVVVSKLVNLGEDEPAPENVAYAVKDAYLKPLLDELPDLHNYEAQPKTPPTGDALIDRVKMAVFLVVAKN